MKRSTINLSNDARFRLAVRTALLAGVSTAVTPVHAQDPAPAATDDEATELEAVEVTGSRLGRADIEGALPIATISREDIDRSGFTSVGELLRNTTFNSLGAFRAQSGSSAQALVAVDLRGLGSERTLVLIDGRRAPKAPFAPSAQDLNAVPIAMVERIEVLTDGASAIYGSDAIAGVINIITRKNYNGASLSFQQMGTDRTGGDSKGGQFVAGINGDRGNMVFGASFFSRDIIFARNSLFNTPGASFFSNNYYLVGFDDLGADNVRCNNGADGCTTGGAIAPDAGEADFIDDNTGHPYYGSIGQGGTSNLPGACPNADPAFYEYDVDFADFDDPSTAANENPYPYSTGPFSMCGYDFNLVAADEAKTGNQSVFVKGTYKINDSWQMRASGAVARATSFGRYAPSLNDFGVLVPASSPNNPFGDQDVYVYHRFAALGTRDNDTDANVYDLSGIFTGEIGDITVDAGARYNQYQYYELGKNYVVVPVAAAYIADGTYNLENPGTSNPASVLNQMKATITRDSIWDTLEYFAEAKMPVFDMGGGTAAVAGGVEYRIEKYFDQYDSLQEGGAIGGAAGNSSGTNRNVKSLYAEMFLPVLDNLEVSVSGRYEKYNDVGNNFAPKISTRFQPMDTVTLRASYGQGFRAPSLDVISALPSFSAEAVRNDYYSCVAAGGTYSGGLAAHPFGRCSKSVQITTTIISNPALEAEDSDQFSIGAAVDITQDIDVSLDFYSIQLDNQISYLSVSDLVTLDGQGIAIPPGLELNRAGGSPTGKIDTAVAGYANQGTFDTSGLDIRANARFTVGDFGRIESNFQMAYILNYEYELLGTTYDTLGQPAVPQYRASLNNSWKMDALSVAFNGNHIAAQDEDQTQATRVPSYTTWDLQVGYELPVLGGAELAVGAINVFGKEPSNKSQFDGRDYNFYLYDQYGTQPYVKFTQKF
jgi:iron complex outermembrane recepter protein